VIFGVFVEQNAFPFLFQAFGWVFEGLTASLWIFKLVCAKI